MGYPYDKTYLEEIQAKPKECERIRDAFYTLRLKFVRDNEGYSDIIDLSIKENFALLGEAFELASDTVGNISDEYHFMWDVLDELIPEGGKK
jgi:hypothetical protein